MIKLLSLFSGIGAFEKALTNLGVPYEVVNYCEIDKYASKSYSAIHGIPESKNLWDITKVDVLNLPKDIDLLTYGFPCQDISLAGKQKGMFNEDGTLTRSGLFFKALDIIECVKPKIAIAENVKALTSKKFTEQFKIVLDSLEKAGYHNYWKVLNAKDYGIPQNRERVFIVSIRKDIDHYIFEFPKPYSLEKRLKDFLEPHVDEKYYLSKVLNPRFTENYIQYDNSGKGYNSQATRLYYQDGLCPTLPNRNSGDKSQVILADKKVVKSLFTETQAKMITHDGNVKRYLNSDVVDKFKEGQAADISFPNGYNKGNRVFDVCPALNTTTTSSSFITKISQTPIIIRKLTPKECYRLMGFSDEDFEKSAQVPTSNTQLYKQAGNSIVVNVLEEILKELFINEKKPKRQTDQTRYEQLTLF